MLDKKLLLQTKAKGRSIKKIGHVIKRKREKICRLIDEYWIYWKNPEEYTTSKKVKQEGANSASEIWTTGSWPHKHHIIRKEKNFLVISIKNGNRFLPLTPRGNEELLINISEIDNLEEILANIKSRIQEGKADKWL